MTQNRVDWLDRLALRVVAHPSQDAQEPEAPEERFSRVAAFKLALAGGAALAFGMAVAPPARAQDRGGCFTQCLNAHDDELQRRVKSCTDTFVVGKLRRAQPESWGRLKVLLFGGTRDIVLAQVALTELCQQRAAHDVRSAKDNCYDRCEETCRKRSMQSSSGRSAATCEVTPPQHAPPPHVPPIPSPTTGVAAECANCAQVGGKCCFGTDPTKLCACANPALDCAQRYGCGS